MFARRYQTDLCTGHSPVHPSKIWLQREGVAGREQPQLGHILQPINQNQCYLRRTSVRQAASSEILVLH